MVLKPRFCGNKPHTPWMLLHTVTQRRHMMHLPESLTRAAVLVSSIVSRPLSFEMDLLDAELACQAPQFAIVAAQAGLAIARMFREQELHHRAAAFPDPLGIGLDDHSFG